MLIIFLEEGVRERYGEAVPYLVWNFQPMGCKPSSEGTACETTT